MRYAIFSDVHANLEAFQVVIKSALMQKAESFISLGDIVGYGPNPNECITLTRNFTDLSLAGNHDWAVLGKLDISYFNPYAQTAIIWTKKQLTAKSKEYLKSLPLSLHMENILLVHASPYQPPAFNYLFGFQDFAKNFESFNEQICLIGHSHLPLVIIQEDKNYRLGRERIEIKDNERYIINAGSVGQPRDNDPRACYIIYDSREKILQFIRVPYDIKTTQDKMLQANLPEFLAKRLELGE